MWSCRDTWNKNDQNGELYSLSGVFFFWIFFSGHGGDRDLERILMPLACDGDYECAWHSTLFLNLLRQQREYDDDFHCTLFTSSSSLSNQDLHTFLKKRITKIFGNCQPINHHPLTFSTTLINRIKIHIPCSALCATQLQDDVVYLNLFLF